MAVRHRGLFLSLTAGLLISLASEARASMTLDFAITPLVNPQVGSLERESDGTLRGTNLAVTSVTQAQTGQVVQLSKYLDFQTAGDGGSNFFILDGLVQKYGGTTPTTYTTPANTTALKQLADGSYLFTMKISYGYVNDSLLSQFSGSTGTAGWAGLLTLNIGKFDNSLAAGQVTSGSLVLTSLAPVPAGESVTAVPEPSSFVLAGLGLVVVAGRNRLARGRSKPVIRPPPRPPQATRRPPARPSPGRAGGHPVCPPSPDRRPHSGGCP